MNGLLKDLGINACESDLRKIQITNTALPDTIEEKEKLAFKFHHTWREHEGYFRHVHKCAATEPDHGGSSSTSKKPSTTPIHLDTS